MLNYWIDGYNLFFRLHKNYQSLKKRKHTLLVTLNKMVKLLGYHVIIVFDGKQKEYLESYQQNWSDIVLIYTGYNQSADDLILERIQEYKILSNQIVVSSDRDLLKKARLLGAQTETVEKFLNHLIQRVRKKMAVSFPSKDVSENPMQMDRLLKIFEAKLENDV